MNEVMSVRGREVTITIKWIIQGEEFLTGVQEYIDYLNEIGNTEIVDIGISSTKVTENYERTPQ